MITISIDESIRFLGFKAFDLAHGRKVSKHLSDIENYFRDPVNNSCLHKIKLEGLLEHAFNTVPYYNKYKKPFNLQFYPVISKTMLKENQDAFMSGSFKKSSLSIVKTSGSYGTPTSYYFTLDKKMRRFAEIIFFNRWAGYEIGMKHAFVRVRPKHRIAKILENELLFNPIGMDDAWLESFRNVLINKSPRCLISYPSVLTALAHYCRIKGDHADLFSLKGIISYAESLDQSGRESIEDIFGCPVLNRYSCEEFGVLAHDCRLKKKLHLNSASYHIELLKRDSDHPASAGEVGRVVVTDLFSYALPLIRYDTGDLAVLGEPCSCGLLTPVLEKIEGRVTEVIYDTKKRFVSPLAVVTPIARTIDGIIQFQFVQKGFKNYTVRLIVEPSFQQDKVELIRVKLLNILGIDALIDFEYVAAIPPLPSGKRPYIINEYDK